MIAAKTNNDEALDMMLKLNIDPNLADIKKYTALTCAVLSENVYSTSQLFKITEKHLDITLQKLAQSKIKSNLFKDSIKSIILRKQNLFNVFINACSFYGNGYWFGWLVREFPELVLNLGVNSIKNLIENAIMSDSSDACMIINSLNLALKDQMKAIAVSRGKSSVLEALNLIDLLYDNSWIKDIYDDVIKSEEFPYCDNIAKVIARWLRGQNTNVYVPLQEILHELKAPTVHYQDDSRNSSDECPSDCPQNRKCLRVRQTQQLVKAILKEMAKKFEIFEDPSLIVVGSMKEDTKVGEVDECDMTLIMPQKYKEYFKFDEKEQRIVATKETIPEPFKEFVKDCVMDTTKYLNTFVEEFYKTIKSGKVKLPTGLKLSTEFTPCIICQSKEDVVPQFVRCRHKPKCEEHQKKKDDLDYVEKCNCKNFSSPCLTFTKIGIVLHLQFIEPDKTLINLDVDVSPPSIPVQNINKYDGCNQKKRQWLEKYRPVNWNGEWNKSYDMTDAGRDSDGSINHDGTRCIRLRRVNRHLVIPEQVSLIMINVEFRNLMSKLL